MNRLRVVLILAICSVVVDDKALLDGLSDADIAAAAAKAKERGLEGKYVLADYYSRAGKAGSAWSSGFVGQSKLLGTKPVVTNNMNITRPAEGSRRC